MSYADTADLTQLTMSGKATRHLFLDMHPHRQVSFYVDADRDRGRTLLE